MHMVADDHQAPRPGRVTLISKEETRHEAKQSQAALNAARLLATNPAPHEQGGAEDAVVGWRQRARCCRWRRGWGPG